MPINPNQLPLYDMKPVWSKTYGWLLVNAHKKILISSTSEHVSFNNADDIYNSACFLFINYV